jgi:hypothetical protein
MDVKFADINVRALFDFKDRFLEFLSWLHYVRGGHYAAGLSSNRGGNVSHKEVDSKCTRVDKLGDG